MKLRALCSATALAALLAGCASTGNQPPIQQSPVSPPPQATPPAISLASEQRRLADLFRDTPVVIAMTPEGHMRVEVPLKYSFKKGLSVVEPPLAKVLDHVVPSARAPGMKARVSAPSDNGKAGLIAQDRAASARDYLIAKGVPVTHFAGVGPAHSDSIEILVGKL
jgi:hypothetical protein